jgi:hypothetical protein
MSLRLWRRKRLFPGARINLSKSGLSLSIGMRGAWWTAGPRGRRVTIGAPGTGLFVTQHYPPASHPHAGRRRWALAIVVAVAIVALYVIGKIAGASP